MAHWRTMVGNRTQFDAADLGGKPLLVQIESTQQGVLKGFNGGRETEEPVVQVRFVGHDRPLGFKATNSKRMITLYGNGDVDTWVGKWVWLVIEMENDPSQKGVKGAKCEAVRVRPIKPTADEIEAASRARGGKKTTPAPAGPPRDDAADQRLIGQVCVAIEAAESPQAVEDAIAPHRDEIKKMDRRLQAIVASAKNVQLERFGAKHVEGAHVA